MTSGESDKESKNVNTKNGTKENDKPKTWQAVLGFIAIIAVAVAIVALGIYAVDDACIWIHRAAREFMRYVYR